MPALPDSHLREFFTQLLTPVNHHPYSWEVKFSALEYINPRGGDRKLVSVFHTLVGIHFLLRAEIRESWGYWKGEIWPLSDYMGQWDPEQWLQSQPSRLLCPNSEYRWQAGNQGTWLDFRRKGVGWGPVCVLLSQSSGGNGRDSTTACRWSAARCSWGNECPGQLSSISSSQRQPCAAARAPLLPGTGWGLHPALALPHRQLWTRIAHWASTSWSVKWL